MSDERDLRKMEWLWFVDIDLSMHGTEDEISETARLGLRTLKHLQPIKPGHRLVMAIVEEPPE